MTNDATFVVNIGAVQFHNSINMLSNVQWMYLLRYILFKEHSIMALFDPKIVLKLMEVLKNRITSNKGFCDQAFHLKYVTNSRRLAK